MNKLGIFGSVSLLLIIFVLWRDTADPVLTSDRREVIEFALGGEAKIKGADLDIFVDEIKEGNLQINSRDAKVLEKLEQFKKNTANISAEKIALERERINNKLQEIRNQVPVEPVKEAFVDEEGDAWEKLDYGQGIIRYDLVAQD